MLNNKKGFLLPYTVFWLLFVLNIFIFVVLCTLNTNKLLDDKNNHYHVFILEERAKRHIKERIDLNEVKTYQNELVEYDQDFIYLTYHFDSIKNVWKVSFRLHHGTIDEYGTIYYDQNTNKITTEIR